MMFRIGSFVISKAKRYMRIYFVNIFYVLMVVNELLKINKIIGAKVKRVLYVYEEY